jgi:hypothetical protein
VAEQYQRDLLTGRWRMLAKSGKEVTSLHIPLVMALRLCLRPEVVMFHCPNGELRDPQTARKLKAMGTMPGVADLTFLWPPSRMLFLELKLPSIKPTPAQLDFARRVEAAGAQYCIARSVSEALELLRERGMIRPGIKVGRP